MEDIITQGAIRTRYYGPTNCRGSRIIVTHPLKTKPNHTYYWNYALDVTENHAAAAQEFVLKNMGSEYSFNKNGYCFDNDYFWTWDYIGGAA